jgi:hypothetical protein
MRNFRIGKLRRLRCDKDSDNREALPRSPPSAPSRRISVAEWRLPSASALDRRWSAHTRLRIWGSGVRILFGRAIKRLKLIIYFYLGIFVVRVARFMSPLYRHVSGRATLHTSCTFASEVEGGRRDRASVIRAVPTRRQENRAPSAAASRWPSSSLRSLRPWVIAARR